MGALLSGFSETWNRAGSWKVLVCVRSLVKVTAAPKCFQFSVTYKKKILLRTLLNIFYAFWPMMGFVLSAQYVCGQAFPKRILRISINKFLSLSFKSFPLTRKEGMTHACDVMETGSPLTSVKGMYKVIIHKQLKYKKILHSYRHNWEETTSRERAKQG